MVNGISKIPSMKTLPLSEVKTKLSGLVDEVLSTDEEVVITKNGLPPPCWSAPASTKAGKRPLPFIAIPL